MRTISILTVILFTFFALPLLAQDGSRFSVGIYSASNFPQHTGSYSSSWSSLGATHSFNSKRAIGIEYGIQGKVKFSRPWVGIFAIGKTQWNNKYNLTESSSVEYGKPFESRQEKSLLFEGTETYEFLNVQMGVAFFTFPKSSPYFAFKLNYNHLVGFEFDPIDVYTPPSTINPTPKYQDRQPAFDGALLCVFEIGGRIFITQNLSINPFATIQLGKSLQEFYVDDTVGQFTSGLNLDWWF